jgi:hypothetical protein
MTTPENGRGSDPRRTVLPPRPGLPFGARSAVVTRLRLLDGELEELQGDEQLDERSA